MGYWPGTVGFSFRCFLAVCAFALLALPGAARAADAPGAPGAVATWTEGDKDGVGTATGTASKTWLTLDDGHVQLSLEADEDVTVACWAAQRQSDLFERAFGRELGVSA